jgi:CheY-like chemotaxis protein
MRHEAPAARAGQALGSVLLVDPNRERRTAAAALLASANVGDVEHASDGDQALVRMLRHPRPRAVVVNWDSAEGRRLVRRIRRDGTLDAVSIVVTGAGQPPELDTGLELGCNAIIVEPDAELRGAMTALALMVAAV